MTALHKHIIQKQTIEITFPSAKNANALQDKIKSIYYEKIVPLLDDLFSGLIKDDTIIRLDKLDIDVGTLNENDLEKQLVEKIIIAVKQQLESSLQFDVKDNSNVQLLSGAQSVTDTFLYFLKQGHFPWWSSFNDLLVLESAITKQYKVGKDLPEKILQLINADANAATRLNFQFSKQFRRFIVEEIFATQHVTQQTFLRKLLLQDDELNTIKNDVRDNVNESKIAKKNLDDDSTLNEQLKKNKQESDQKEEEKKFDVDNQSSSQSTTGKDNNESKEFNDKQADLKQMPLNINEKNKEAIDEQQLNQSYKKQEDIKNNNSVFAEDEKALQQANSFSKKGNTDAEKDDFKNKNRVANEVDISFNQKQIENENLFADKTYHQKIKKEFDKETIYLGLAGLVILHPFIIEFFAALKLTKNNQFISDAFMHKAVHLLGYIATGKTEIEEQLLILPKLLCGMDLTAPIEKEIIISDEEKHEVNELLNTIIAYWKAIKNTSPDGLRGSFLLRAGKLSPREGGWQLDVEQKAWDILLGKLPWGISIIKLPWMQEMLFVNWQ